MFRVILGEDDAVLVCMPVSTAVWVVQGSEVTTCMECDISVWKAPGRPRAVFDEKTSKLRPTGLGDPTPNIVMCLRCAHAHQEAQL